MDVVIERLLHEEKKLRDRLSSVISSDSALTIKSHMRRKGPRCHYCKRFGHIQRNCSERSQNERKFTNTTSQQMERKYPKHRVNKVEVEQKESSNSDSDIGLVVSHALSIGESKSLSNWIVDSGATCHICNNDSQFLNLNSLEKPMDITLGDGHSLKATKQGVVEIAVKTPNGKERKCVLHDVIHVPDLSYNLFSVPKATERRATVMFDDLKCCIFNKKQKLITEGIKKGRLYHLECENSAGSEESM